MFFGALGDLNIGYQRQLCVFRGFRSYEAHDGAGGRATYRPLAAFGRDGHSLAGNADGVAIWGPLVESFLAGLN